MDSLKGSELGVFPLPGIVRQAGLCGNCFKKLLLSPIMFCGNMGKHNCTAFGVVEKNAVNTFADCLKTRLSRGNDLPRSMKQRKFNAEKREFFRVKRRKTIVKGSGFPC